MPVLHILLPFPRPLRSPTSHMYVLIISHYILQKKKVCAWWNIPIKSRTKWTMCMCFHIFQKYDKFWRFLLEHFIKYVSEEWISATLSKKKDIIIEISFNMIFQFMSFLSTLSLSFDLAKIVNYRCWLQKKSGFCCLLKEVIVLPHPNWLKLTKPGPNSLT